MDEIYDTLPPIDEGALPQRPDAPSVQDTVRQGTRSVNRADGVIWGVYTVLCLVSIIELFSASSHEVTADNIYGPLIRHLITLVIGFVVMKALQRVPYEKFYRWTWVIVCGSVLAMLYVLVAGDIINGARRSFSVGPIRVFPAELIKFSVVMGIAWCMTRYRLIPDARSRRTMLTWSLFITVVSAALLFSQGLTNTILLSFIALAMIVVGGVSGKQLVAVFIIFGLLGGGAYAYKKVIGGGRTETQANRLTSFLEPNKWADSVTINDQNAQEQYSFIAQAHGGVTGVMPGNSRETSRLALAFSDYIFAIIVEELGLWGGILLMICYLFLLSRAVYIAYRCRHTYPALLILGMALFIVLQAMFHIAIVTGAAPVSGQPLPLISKGGTSILITSVALGIMLSVSRNALRSSNKREMSEAMQALPEDVSAVNISQDK